MIYLGIYIVGFICSLYTLKFFGKAMGFDDFDKPNPDYDSNSKAHLSFSIFWPLFWGVHLTMTIWWFLRDLIEKILK